MHEVKNRLGHILTFVGITHALVHHNFFAQRILSPHVLLKLLFVVRNQHIGRLDNALGATVVLLQLVQRRVGVVLLKVQNVPNVGASKRINTLRIVTNHTNVFKASSQRLHN